MAYSNLSHGYMFVLVITFFNLGIKRKGSAHLGSTYAKIRIIQRLACLLQRWCKFVIHFIFSHQYEKMHHTSLGNWKIFKKWDCFQDVYIRITKIQNTVTSNAGKNVEQQGKYNHASGNAKWYNPSERLFGSFL